MNAEPRTLTRTALGSFVLVLLLGSLVTCGERDPRPSFLLFVIDTTRFDDVSAYDSALKTTPKLDRLAEAGLLYTRAFAQAPWTLPSQVSMLTGMLPSQHGVGWSSTRAPDSLVTLAERLRAAGYQTLAVSENPWMTPTFGIDQGFEEHFFVRRERVSAEQIVSEWLEYRRRKGPFFVFVNVVDPHAPYFGGKACDLLPPGVSMSAARAISSEPREHFCRAEPEALDMQIMKALHRCDLRAADAKLGRVHALLSSGSERLVSVVTADHGEHFGEHQLVSHQFSLRNELLHVPLVVHGLAGIGPSRIDDPVQLSDIAPSILRWAGLDVPAEMGARPLPSVNGASDATRSIIAEYSDYELLSADSPSGRRMIRNAKEWRRRCDEQDRVFGHMRAVLRYPHKAILYSEYPSELFDLSTDAEEARDLSSKSPDLARELLSEGPLIEPTSQNTGGEPAPEPSAELLRSLEALGYLEGAAEPAPAD